MATDGLWRLLDSTGALSSKEEISSSFTGTIRGTDLLNFRGIWLFGISPPGGFYSSKSTVRNGPRTRWFTNADVQKYRGELKKDHVYVRARASFFIRLFCAAHDVAFLWWVEGSDSMEECQDPVIGLPLCMFRQGTSDAHGRV